MYVCTTDEMTVTFSSTIPVEKKTIVVPYVDTNAKVTNFLPFCTIGISTYQNSILPYFIIPSTFSPQPQPSSPLERHRQKDGQHSSPLVPLVHFFHWAHGALPAGALLGWPNYGVDGRLNKSHFFSPALAHLYLRSSPQQISPNPFSVTPFGILET